MPTTAELIRRGAAQHAERVALRWADTALSSREVFTLACRIGNALQDAGVARGAHVALLLFTSGTTGKLEAVLPTQGNFPAIAADMRASSRRCAASSCRTRRRRRCTS